MSVVISKHEYDKLLTLKLETDMKMEKRKLVQRKYRRTEHAKENSRKRQRRFYWKTVKKQYDKVWNPTVPIIQSA